MNRLLPAAVCGLAFAAALGLPAAAGEVVVETGALSPIGIAGNNVEYYFEWNSAFDNSRILELDFVLKDGVPAPTSTTLIDNVFYSSFWKPDPSASNEYFGGCGGFYICNTAFVAAPAGVTRIRYTTYWGDKPLEIVAPLSPIQINFSAEFAAALSDEPYDANYRILSVPEPGAWVIMILGFAATGAALRHRRRLSHAA